jgi:hypothetical protein
MIVHRNESDQTRHLKLTTLPGDDLGAIDDQAPADLGGFLTKAERAAQAKFAL